MKQKGCQWQERKVEMPRVTLGPFCSLQRFISPSTSQAPALCQVVCWSNAMSLILKSRVS